MCNAKRLHFAESFPALAVANWGKLVWLVQLKALYLAEQAPTPRVKRILGHSL